MQTRVEQHYVLLHSLVLEIQVVDGKVLIYPIELLQLRPCLRLLLHQIGEREPLKLNLLLIDDFLLRQVQALYPARLIRRLILGLCLRQHLDQADILPFLLWRLLLLITLLKSRLIPRSKIHQFIKNRSLPYRFILPRVLSERMV